MKTIDRRKFLEGGAAVALATTALPGLANAATIAKSPHGKPLAGVFPIGWSPSRPNGKLDLDSMVAQQKFINRGKVAGIAWPQNASAWQTLSTDEWHQGADALLSVKGPSAVVLGVQTMGFDIAKSADYARYAGQHGADAVMSLTPPGASDAEIISYFKTLASASNLPLMVQAVGDVSVDTLVNLSKAVPSVIAVKDEATESPLERGPRLQARSGGKLEDFSGGGGYTFFPEMERGFLGTCPYVGLSDVLQQCFNLYQAGKKREAFNMFGLFMAFKQIPRSNDYVLIARGVFPEDAVMRVNPPAKGKPARPAPKPITDFEKAEIRRALSDYLKPVLVA
jgi:dihydrodipicolinate synthase/N-acetylneuraminate lyase